MNDFFAKFRPWLRFVPTSLTLGNALCGFAAILHTLNAYAPEQGEDIPALFAISAWLIIFSMFFDMLDGWTARKFHATSEHGMEMDSLSDMVTFGVAPAVLVAVMAHTSELQWLGYRTVWLLGAVYLACAALRLALYNVLARQPHPPADKRRKDAFHGLPSPGAAAAVCSLVILYAKTSDDFTFVMLAELLPIYAAILGLLMVSSIPYRHIGKWLGHRENNKPKMLIVLIFCLAFAWNSALTAAICINAYVLWAPLKVLALWIVAPDVEPDDEEEGDDLDDEDEDEETTTRPSVSPP